ncbi:MAG: aldo/keto reductase [Planctomycetota bacterium]
MRYRVLGQTGMRVSVIGFGASPLGGVFRNVTEEECVRAVHTALDAGINYFDCSPYYGLTKAETMLGKCLAGVPRSRYCLATKVGRYGDNTFDFSAQRVTAGLEESLKRLRVDYVDLLQCHDIEFGALKQIPEETVPALRKLQKSGKTRFIGITGLPLKIFPAVIDQAPVDTILSYCHYCLNDTALLGLIPYLKARQVGIISASPLAMGLLSEKGPPSWHPAGEDIKRACAQAAACCKRQGADISRLAMQFALANEDIATTLVGTATAAHIKNNLAALEAPCDPALAKEVAAILEPIKNKTWPQGRLENN